MVSVYYLLQDLDILATGLLICTGSKLFLDIYCAARHYYGGVIVPLLFDAVGSISILCSVVGYKMDSRPSVTK